MMICVTEETIESKHSKGEEIEGFVLVCLVNYIWWSGEVEETTQDSVFMAIILVNERYVLGLTLLPFFQLLSYAMGRVFFLRIAWVWIERLEVESSVWNE